MLDNTITIWSFWYKCPNCKSERSVSQSHPLYRTQKVTCPICKMKYELVGLKEEPEVELKRWKG